MKRVTRFLTIVALIPILAACSYFETDKDLDISGKPPVAESYDITNDDMRASSQVDTQVLSAPAPSVETLISQETKGSVQVYPIGGPALAVGVAKPSSGSYDMSDAIPVEKMPAVPVQSAVNLSSYGNDPSVEVFPLDDTMAASVPPALLAREQPAYNIVNAVTGGNVVVYFDHDEVEINESGKQILSDVIAGKTPQNSITVEGYASKESSIQDSTQRQVANFRVSMERAISVVRALIENGVPAGQITAVAHGENNQKPTPAESRRVEIVGIARQE